MEDFLRGSGNCIHLMRSTALLLMIVLAFVLAGCGRKPPARPEVMERVNSKDGSVILIIPPGEFTMGSRDYRDSKPQFRVYLAAYGIGKYEVTNRQFARFEKAAGYKAEGSWRRFFRAGMEDHPVLSVSWYDARAYCAWAGLRLPTEAEWEKAARGSDRRIYPWGNEWDRNRCNNRSMDIAGVLPRMAALHKGRGTTPVGSFPDGASFFGALDMAGNACEWTSSAFDPYPYRVDDGREGKAEPVEVSLRGGSWAYDHIGFFRTDTRSRCKPPVFSYVIGFRVAASPESLESRP
jgi:serine/threonine-protein kinase